MIDIAIVVTFIVIAAYLVMYAAVCYFEVKQLRVKLDEALDEDMRRLRESLNDIKDTQVYIDPPTGICMKHFTTLYRDENDKIQCAACRMEKEHDKNFNRYGL